MIPRNRYLHLLQNALKRTPITVLLGPRQCGKTTLAHMLTNLQNITYLDLESHEDLSKLQNPTLYLESLRGLVVIDEIQQKPDLFPVLRVLADKKNKYTKFLILGSASPSLIKHASESLAGRIEFIELGGFDMEETGVENLEKLWLRGCFPRSFLAKNNKDSMDWRENFINTFLQRDIPQLGIFIPAPAMRRFWTMLAHYHGQIWNASELAQALGLSGKTVRNYLDILTQTYMVRQLQPWYENIHKRQVKSPKIYLRDSGIFHTLMSIPEKQILWSHPKIGASWEGFMLEQILKTFPSQNIYFWSSHSGAEIDLVIMSGGKRYGIEFKWNEAPTITRSMQISMHDLNLEKIWVIYPGKNIYPVHKKITVVSATKILQIIKDIY
ncbi:MAG: ATP-binding protein [Candidatus Omnitrophica bacterium]|nr:ATP-binding protein [Candidatus Omnitrophota bacterium]